MHKKKIKFKVQCANNPEHIFEKVIEIVAGTENTETELQAYCPFCDEFVDITIQGEPSPDTILRRILP